MQNIFNIMLYNILFTPLRQENRGCDVEKANKSVGKMRMIKEPTLVSDFRYASSRLIPEHLQAVLKAYIHDILCRRKPHTPLYIPSESGNRHHQI